MLAKNIDMNLSTEKLSPTVFSDAPASAFLKKLREQQFLKVKDLIKNQQLIAIEPNRTIDKALMIMVNQRKRHLPVITKHTGELKGIVSERDLRVITASPHLDHVNLEHALQQLSEKSVDSIMIRSVFTVDEDDSVVNAVKIMRLSKVGGLPVMNKENKVVGIITRQDCLDHLIRILDPWQIDQEDMNKFEQTHNKQ